ncbi:DNA (cytosine-5-)-methyltransferase [Handroanthus impetiginosus]|uniref:DNA (Cytosine-5-)-methyltransferase n=1 Tax=Handroanthus impetiginosus TaxID=429701 RepID=A0A2G9GQ62_9LAMI|nr:DNA (cytosine-5-)-methyltransferase [Handroanthus impetiginosus]
MKTRQKLRHQSPPRKSHRRSSSASSSIQLSAQLKSKPKTDRTRADDAWALSLHVVEQLPLKICHPSREEDNSFRRSSRFTTNKDRTPLPKRSSKPKALPAQLRRSPRLSSSSSAPALTLRSGKKVGPGEEGSKKRRRTEDGEGGGQIGKKVKLGLNNGGLSRSLRLSGGENGNLKAQLLALPEPGSKSVSKSCFSEKCLRSRTVLMRVGDEKEKAVTKSGSSVNEKCLRSRIIKCALVESPESSEKRVVRSAFNELPSVQENSTSTEKCLRSRTVKMCVGNRKEKADKSASKISGKCLSSKETERALIEFPVASESRNSLRRSSRLNQERGESPKFEMLALPEKRASLSKKCLSSGAYGVKSSQKCLRSQGTECGLIEFPKNSETINLSSNLRRSGRLNQQGGESPKFEILALPEKSASSSKKCLSSGAYGVKPSEKNLSSPGTESALIQISGGSGTRNLSSRLRRSTRLNQEGGESPKLEILSLPEKSNFSSKKSLSSSACGVTSNEKCSSSSASGVKSNEKCLMDPKIESDKEKCDSELMSEKCLRSRKVLFRVSVDEVDEKATASIEEQGSSKNESKAKNFVKSEKKEKSIACSFIGEPIPEEEAQKKWGWRYEIKRKKRGKSWKINADEEDEIILNVDRHYAQAKVGNCVLDIGDCVYVKIDVLRARK